jgi:hypothetical protein
MTCVLLRYVVLQQEMYSNYQHRQRQEHKSEKLLKPNFLEVIFKDSVDTAKETPHFIIKKDQLVNAV